MDDADDERRALIFNSLANLPQDVLADIGGALENDTTRKNRYLRDIVNELLGKKEAAPEQEAGPIFAESEHTRIDLVWIGEGNDGNYDPDDPDDEPLMRFDVSHRDKKGDKWEQVDDGSYCTQLSRDLPRETLMKAAKLLLREIGNRYDKRRMEELSWIDETWVK